MHTVNPLKKIDAHSYSTSVVNHSNIKWHKTSLLNLSNCQDFMKKKNTDVDKDTENTHIYH